MNLVCFLTRSYQMPFASSSLSPTHRSCGQLLQCTAHTELDVCSFADVQQLVALNFCRMHEMTFRHFGNIRHLTAVCVQNAIHTLTHTVSLALALLRIGALVSVYSHTHTWQQFAEIVPRRMFVTHFYLPEMNQHIVQFGFVFSQTNKSYSNNSSSSTSTTTSDSGTSGSSCLPSAHNTQNNWRKLIKKKKKANRETDTTTRNIFILFWDVEAVGARKTNKK